MLELISTSSTMKEEKGMRVVEVAAGFARLDPRNRRDSVIIYGLCHGAETDERQNIFRVLA